MTRPKQESESLPAGESGGLTVHVLAKLEALRLVVSEGSLIESQSSESELIDLFLEHAAPIISMARMGLLSPCRDRLLTKVYVKSLEALADTLRAGHLPPSPELAANLLDKVAERMKAGER